MILFIMIPLRPGNDIFRHLSEKHFMEGIQRIPIHASPYALRYKISGHKKSSAMVYKFQPGLSGKSHLRQQKQSFFLHKF